MRKLFISVLCLGTAIMIAGCDPGASNTAGNKAANAGNAASAPVVDRDSLEADIRKMMDDFAAALNKGDVDAIGRMYSDDYTLIDADGVVQTKSSRLDAIKSGKIKMEGLKFNDLKIKTNPAGDGAVITGRVSGKTITDGKTEEANSMVTWVVAKTKDKGWQFVNAQITNIKASAAKPDEAKPDDKKSDGKAADTVPERK